MVLASSHLINALNKSLVCDASRHTAQTLELKFVMQNILLVLISISLFGCNALDFDCELKTGDSFHFAALIEKLDTQSIEYEHIGQQAISYSCKSAVSVKKIENSLLDHYYPDCGAQFSDSLKQAMFISSLGDAGINYWVVKTDKGEKVNCNTKDKEHAQELATQAFFQ
jgi:hypothetical protein